jgi:pyruvate/2-oxoglutarate dehydrogenase complex dihydrolipoamide acyltransferase (E2) component
VPGKNLAALSFSTFLSLVSHAVVAATTAAAFLSTAFLLLTHSWEEIKPAAMTADQPAPTATIATTADQPAPAATIATTADQPAPTNATVATPNQPAPTNAMAAAGKQPAPTAVPHAMRPYYPASPSPASPSIVAIEVNPQLIAAFARAAANKGITLEQYRNGRVRFLRQQQAELELELTQPNRSAAETRRLERQKAYWGRAIEQTLAVP